jgi:hypothetical protein
MMLLRALCIIIVILMAGGAAIWWGSQPGGTSGFELNVLTLLALIVTDKAFDVLCLVLAVPVIVTLAPLAARRRRRPAQ